MRWVRLVPHVLVVMAFLGVVSTYYHPPFGFTEFLTLAPSSDPDQLPDVRAVPHVEDRSGGYDGQFYAQLAVEPLLADPAIDRALDAPPFRARRILFSWTAYVIGLGRPAWILQIFAVQNVVAWLVFAWLLLRWFPAGSARSFLLWAACLSAHGMLSSVRYALLDGPSVVLIAAAVIAAEQSRPWLSAVIVGVSGLARETNVLAAALFARLIDGTARGGRTAVGASVIAVVPILLWVDYLRAIYLSSTFAGGENIVAPFTGMVWKARGIAAAFGHGDWSLATVSSACALVAFVTQAGGMGYAALRRREASPWLAVALAFAALGLVSHQVVWAGAPGAITRVTLPLLIGFNVVCQRAPWPVLVFGNLGVLPGVWSFLMRA